MLLSHVVSLIQNEGWRVGNVDATVLAQAPKLAPHIPSMRENVAGVLSVSTDRVSIKATTEERLGFTGEKLGISSMAVALIERT